MAIRISNPKVQRFNKKSPYAPLAGGKMHFYEPGQTVIRKSTFTTALGDIPNTNPVTLDANGFDPDIFGSGSYRVVLKDSDGVQQWDRNPVNFDEGGGGFIDWSSSITYDAGGDNIVTGSDGKYYVSIQGSNLNHDPNAGGSPTFWTEFDLLKQWNTNEVYSADDPVTYAGDFYAAITSSNQGNTPSSSPSNWKKAGAITDTAYSDWSALTTYGAGGGNIVTGSDGKYYVSIQAANLNQDPNAGGAPTFWTEFDLLAQWNTNETYDTDDPVTYLGDYYLSITSSNSGNTPSSSPSNWRRAGSNVTVQKFTSSGTWTKPAGVAYAIVEVIGGGGGGGGAASAASVTGGGGGGGGYARVVLTSLASSVTVTIGAAGTGGTAGDNNGVSGGATSFGSLCVATGGIAGQYPSNDFTADGGIGTTGDMLSAGEAGVMDRDAPAISADRSARGGDSAFGAGGKSRFTSGTGNAGRNYGGGGAGGYNDASTLANRAGGAGAAGFVIVTEYF